MVGQLPRLAEGEAELEIRNARVFAYRFFSTTSWVSQMTSHPDSVFTHFPAQSKVGGLDKLKIYPPDYLLLSFGF